MSPGTPGGRDHGKQAGGVLVLLMIGGLLLFGRAREDVPPAVPAAEEVPPVREAPAPIERAAPSQPPAPGRIPPAATGEALSAALNEERVVLTSTAVIEGIDTDRPWVCTGELMTLSARVGGTAEPDAVSRWVWPGTETGAELQPGTRLPWRAPATPGRYFVRFQLCKDLGGRRVGVLAEQAASIDVRACGDEEQARALRIEVTQQGPTAFAFRAVSPHPATAYTWDFGDGRITATAAPTASHVFTGEPEARVHTVRVSARGAGAEQTAMAFVQVRGAPASDAPPRASLQLAREASRPENEGWRSQVQVDVPEGGAITWERVERLTVTWDDQVDTRTGAWREVVTVEEELGRGGFRGHVTVPRSDVRPEVKQVIDFLHGRDATGTEVSLSWSAYKAEPLRPVPVSSERPPAK
ncbi:PKD domain-containing protein [Corallococcus macrosporus]|uniref:PKD domain-containing protein n=1 Tax=Corallococcus macrosporus TaxID=35 RepID=A0ABS3D7Y8_9BACT|nr:PKD domain-containing protein [Corallococcus macrosporus]MBN8227774.1 PKD domain-containing protein [Corallococcus macrosporus]